ncbi:MAG TPA: glycosyl hydrolase family 79 C-terminal domain-containing protein [Solirubrobacteraceae bacterium]|nr:glycosyl hydrolase family 79 C-terminal domain-containing protein [Solirubrobacteraceae bacterium]
MDAVTRAGRALTLVASGCVASVALAAALATATPSPVRAPATAHGGMAALPRLDARVRLTHGRPLAIPRSFLGISAEYWTIPDWAREVGTLARITGQLATDGPLRLRVGGDSADRASWSPKRELPEWAFELTPAWLRQADRIVRDAHLQLILDLNIMSSTPRLAAVWARKSLRSLPRGSVRGFEIGNEPDIYNHSAWQHLTGGKGVPRLPSHITPTSYARSFNAYAAAVARAAPGVPLLAPALAEPQKHADWIVKLLAAPHPRLAGITVHRYPYSACARRSAPTYPSIPRVLSENASAGMGATARALERITDRARLPLWMTETDSVTCGGLRGVSNTFATALWAPDALFELIRAGTEAAFVHVRPPLVNMAFSLTRSGLTARPLLYGLLLFARTLGPGAELMPLRVTTAPSYRLKAWAVRVRGNLVHVLLLNKGARSGHVALDGTGARGATVERLRAPRIAASDGVTLAGQRLSRSGTWVGARRTEPVTASSRGIVLALPAYSAALVTLPAPR